MQSANYVPGVSGWKLMKNGSLEFNSSGDPCLSSVGKEESLQPFIVVDGVTYIRQESVDESCIQGAELAPQWTVKLELLNGQYVAAGIGLGIASQFLVSADRFAVNDRDAEQILEELEGRISQTELVSAVAAQAEQIKPIAETVREVIREELKPGGILHRK